MNSDNEREASWAALAGAGAGVQKLSFALMLSFSPSHLSWFSCHHLRRRDLSSVGQRVTLRCRLPRARDKPLSEPSRQVIATPHTLSHTLMSGRQGDPLFSVPDHRSPTTGTSKSTCARGTSAPPFPWAHPAHLLGVTTALMPHSYRPSQVPGSWPPSSIHPDVKAPGLSQLPPAVSTTSGRCNASQKGTHLT